MNYPLDQFAPAEELTIFKVLRLTFVLFPRKFAACLKPPSRDNHRKASYPKMQQRDQDAGLTHDYVVKVVVKTTPLPSWPRCRLTYNLALFTAYNAHARPPRGGGRGDNDPGAHRLQRGHELERGPKEITLRNWHVKPEGLFFGDHLISTEKTVRISVKTFFLFFGDHMISRTKLQHFLRLFWTSQNRNSVIFELASGPLLVPGATAYMYFTSIGADFCRKKSIPEEQYLIFLRRSLLKAISDVGGPMRYLCSI